MNMDRPTINVNGTECYVNLGNYPAAKLAMSIQLVEKDSGEPYAVVSKNFGNYSGDMVFVQPNSTFIDANNLGPDAGTIMDQMGGKPYTRWGSPVEVESGWCTYPLYEFDQARLHELDPAGHDKYMSTWQRECQIQQMEMNKAMFGEDYEDEADDGFDF